jgi:hypothetical protein
MRYLLALPALYLAGFLWHLGRDHAEAVRVVTTRRARSRRRGEVEAALRQEQDAERGSEERTTWSTSRRLGWKPVHAEDVWYIGNAGAARWTVQ